MTHFHGMKTLLLILPFFESIEDRDIEKYDDLADMHDFDADLSSYVNENLSLLEQTSNSSLNFVVGTS